MAGVLARRPVSAGASNLELAAGPDFANLPPMPTWTKQLISGPVLLVALYCAPRGLWAAGPAAMTPKRPAVMDLNTPREFPSITSRGAWQARAKDIRQQILVSAGLWPMPEKTPLHPHVFGKIERDGYTVEKVYFQTYPG